MRILIRFTRTDPPAGRVAVLRDPDFAAAGDDGIRFAGWLGLLRALYEVLRTR